jgi:adenylate cyclase
LERKLTTIIVADVAGYSRLMGRDEEHTHRRIASLRNELLKPAIAAQGGTFIKDTGDGFLAEFPSVVDALRCGVGIQDGVAASNAGLPEGEHIAFRMGINLGDVIADGGDIFGDGVNIAARLEGLSEPGGIVVSRSVRDHVRDKLNVTFEDLGEQAVKNIRRPVRAFRIRGEAEFKPPEIQGDARTVPRRHVVAFATAGVVLALTSGFWWAPQNLPNQLTAFWPSVLHPHDQARRPASPLSILVLPFANLSADAQQDYFVDGITESLTTDLSRALPGSFVVARGTALTYKGKSSDAGQVGRDLNVRYVIAGSVTTSGDRVRVNAQLTDAPTNTELWAERFDKMRSDILDVQDQIVGRLTRAAGLQVIDIEARRSERLTNQTAVDFVMRGQAIANRPASRQNMVTARRLFEQALDYDPDNVDAIAGVATTYVFEVLNSYYNEGREERLLNAAVLLRRALASDPRHVVARKVHAALLRAEGRFEEAIAASKSVISQNPGEPWAYKEVGLSHLYLGRMQDALDWFEKADQIGPRDPSRWIWLGAMGRVQFFLGRNDEAIRMLRMSADANPSDSRAYALLAAVFALSRKAEDAKSALAECLRLQPQMTIKRLFSDWSVPLEATSRSYLLEHERFRDGLRLAGMQEE